MTMPKSIPNRMNVNSECRQTKKTRRTLSCTRYNCNHSTCTIHSTIPMVAVRRSPLSTTIIIIMCHQCETALITAHQHRPAMISPAPVLYRCCPACNSSCRVEVSPIPIPITRRHGEEKEPTKYVVGTNPKWNFIHRKCINRRNPIGRVHGTEWCAIRGRFNRQQ